MIRALCFAGALGGAVSLSQFPEFSQQYLQRLAGQVDALTLVVKEFDASALAEGLGREEALEQIAGSAFEERHQADMRAMFARHARLSDNLLALRDASPLSRLTLVHRMADGDTLAAVWADFTPAVPVSVAGAAAAGTGFLGGWAAMAAVLAALTAPLRRARRSRPVPTARREPIVRPDPPVAKPTLVAETPGHVRRLSGVQR